MIFYKFVKNINIVAGSKVGSEYLRISLISDKKFGPRVFASLKSSQRALSAFSNTDKAREEVRTMNEAFMRRRNLVASLLRKQLPRLSFVEPEGAFYFFLKIDSLFDDKRAGSVDVCSWILQEAGVAMVPGSAFGDDRFARLSFATSDDILEDAVGRMASLLNE